MKTPAQRTLVLLLLTAGLSVFVAPASAVSVKSVGSVRHGTDTQVTVVFTDPVDPVSGGTPGNYTFTGGVTVTGAGMMTGLPAADAVGVAENPAPAGRVVNNQCVVLTVTGLAADASATITIQGVKDTATPPNTIPSTTITFKDSGYAWAESGTPALAGKVIAVGTNGFDIFSAGSAQWANYDEVVMVYKEVTGDFDFKARVEFQDFSSHWARAGVMAREALNEGENAATQQGNPNATPPVPGKASRYASVHGNPFMDFNENGPSPLIHGANNNWESHVRLAPGAQTGSANTTPGAPPYPNAWVRIQRQGGDIHTFHGSDGVNWDPAADRLDADWLDVDSNPSPLNAKLYVGASFGPETGNIPATDAAGKNRLFLYQIRFSGITVPYVRLVDPHPAGVFILIEDAPPPGSGVDTTTVQLTFDGNPVTASAIKSGSTTTVAYKAATAFAPNSGHSFSLTFKDNATPANNQKIDRTITIPNYSTIPAGYALASASTPGFNVRAHQIDTTRGPGDENSLANAEQQAADGYIDPATPGVPYPNTADLTGATGGIFAYNNVINWNNNGTAYGGLNNPADIGNWQDTNAAPYNIADVQFPGMPGSGSANHNNAVDAAYNSFVEEVSAYIQLAAGAYRMGVNSDDGFKVSVAPGTPDVFGLQLGVLNTGRASANSFFDFVVTADGYFPFRLLWWNGVGGANLEWFIVDLSTGQRYLINQNDPKAPKAFRTAAGRAYVKSVLPSNGFAGVETNSPVKIVLVDGSTTVVDGSISLWIDGNQVTPTINNGATTTVTYNGAYKYVTSHTGTLVWGESTTPQTLHTNDFTFSIRQQTPDDLPSHTAGSFWIEAEDFDGSGTPVPDAVNTMPYDIGAAGAGPYDMIGATLNVDYFNNDTLDNGSPTTYRSAGDPNISGRSVDVARDAGANFGLRRPGGFDMTTNYKIGWGDNADWYNYTRKITPGLYTAVVALSRGDAAIGTPDAMGGTLSIVTAGVGTTSQTLKNVGTFNGPSSGAWSYNNLVPMYAPDGSQAAFKITTPTTTLRFSLRAGDYDWFALIPVTGVPPKLTSASPLANTATGASSEVPRNAKVRLTIEDFSTAVVQNTVKLFFDSNDVTTSATITKPADITTITFDPGLLAGGSTHSYELRFTDNGSPAVSQTNKATFTVSAALGTPGQFLIEAEDFNQGGGQAVAGANNMPYTGNGYNGLGAIFNVDYHSTESLTAADGWTPVYRTGPPITAATQAPLNDNLGGNLGRVRSDGWQMTVDFKIGWTGTGDWYNYTRTIPNDSYQVYAALSHGDAPSANATGLRGAIDLVSAGSTNRLGVFQAPATGGWGLNALIPMQGPSTNGVPETVSLSGQQTLRFYTDSGDFDYFLLVPATAQIRVNSIAITGGQVTIQWTGGGTIEWTTNLTPPTSWTPTGDSDGSYSESVTTAGNKYYRIKQ